MVGCVSWICTSILCRTCSQRGNPEELFLCTCGSPCVSPLALDGGMDSGLISDPQNWRPSHQCFTRDAEDHRAY